MKKSHLLAVIVVSVLVGCGRQEQAVEATPDLQSEAERIAYSSIIIDTHIDVPYRLQSKPDDVSRATESGDFD